jgi:hypothetical protein
MSPSKRTDKKRRRVWAAPFVLTTALALPAGCVVKEGPPPSEPKPAGVVTDHRGDTTHEAPPTDPNATPNTPENEQTPPVIVANPPAQNSLPDAPASGGKLVASKDGTCWFHFDAGTCPENATCNPPPPRQVKCK